MPHVVRCCVEEVERRGMDEVGIYRISGATNDIAELKTAFDSSKKTNIPPKCVTETCQLEQRFPQTFVKFSLDSCCSRKYVEKKYICKD